MSSQLQHIALDQLTVWSGNVRKTGRKDQIDELGASILAHGLLTPLIVIKRDGQGYAVVAGGRRLLACQMLAKKSLISADMALPCIVRDDAQLTEVSLAENVVRTAMHPADQFEAFAKLADQGFASADIAQRFGVSETVVAQRLKLGRLSPKIMRAYRSGEIGIEQAQAFALSDDRNAQERVFAGLSEFGRSPAVIRRALTEGEIPSSDKRVRLVGLYTIEAAGGTIRRDLFDSRDEGYVQDSALLDRLVTQKLEAQAEQLRAEGWGWVKIVPDFSYADANAFGRLYPKNMKLAKNKQQQLEKLLAQKIDLTDKIDADDTDDRAIAALEKVDAKIEQIEVSALAYPPKKMSKAGAIISIGYDGSIEIKRGLIHPEDVRAAKKAAKAVADVNGSEPGRPALPAALVTELSAHRTAALAVELTSRPDLALAGVVHALGLSLLYSAAEGSCLSLSARITSVEPSIAHPETSAPLRRLAAECERWGDVLPADPADFWMWCLSQSRDTLLDILALIAASSVDAMVRKHDYTAASRLAHADALADELSLDMTAWYKPSADCYFGRISRTQILADYKDARGHDPAPAWLKMKKSDLAKRVAEAVEKENWLPEPLRRPLAECDSVRSPALSEAAE